LQTAIEFLPQLTKKKATRIAGERFDAVKLVTTIDILAYESVQALLGHDVLAECKRFRRYKLQECRLGRINSIG
jgi:hypothetical protein